MEGMELILLLLLGAPAVFASLARSSREAISIACVPGAFCLFTLYRLWEMSREEQTGCGLGAGIVFFCALFSGLSTALALGVALIRHHMRPGQPPERSGVGLTPEP